MAAADNCSCFFNMIEPLREPPKHGIIAAAKKADNKSRIDMHAYLYFTSININCILIIANLAFRVEMKENFV